MNVMSVPRLNAISPYFVFVCSQRSVQSGRTVMNAGFACCTGEARRSACRPYLPDECTACFARLTVASPLGLSAI